MKLLEKIKKKENLFLLTLTILIFLLFLPHYVKSLINFPYQLNLQELLINYQGGFIRRGIFGEIILKIYQTFNIDPLKFLSSIFILISLLQIFIFYKLLVKYQNNYFLLIFILFGPATILFSIYDVSAYMLKDKFINILILIHVFFASYFIKKNSLKNYNLFLIFFIIPTLNFNFLMHENQFLFLGIHILVSSYVYQSLSKKNFFKTKIIYAYALILIPILLIIFDSNLNYKIQLIKISLLENFPFIWEKFPEVASFLSKETVWELEGNLNLKIGALMKIYMFYNYPAITNTMIAFILSVSLIFIIFHSRLKEKLLIFNKRNKFNYLFLFLPALIVSFLTTDFGRAFNMISMHYLAFYLIFPNQYNIKNFSIININKSIKNYLICIFLFFYCFFWTMPHAIGWITLTDVRNSSLIEEIVNLSIHTFNITDKYLITLPRADFMK